MAKPWGGAGAWALDAELAEEEERGSSSAGDAAHVLAAGEPAQSFPSLRESAVAASKPKKKKPVTMSLSELTTGTYVGPGGGRRQPSVESKGLTPDEILRLPTGPRERSAEEVQQARFGGGGFRSYGLGSGGGGGGGFSSRRSDEGRRPYGGGGGFEDEPGRGPPPPRVSDLEQSSRADEDDNWGANKRSITSSSIGSGRNDRDRYSALGGASKADEDDWSRGKQPMQPRQSGFGLGFRDSPAPTDSDRWVRGGTVGGSLPYNTERRKLVLDPPKKETGEAPPALEAAKSRPNPFGAARPREDVLSEKGLDWKKMDTEIDTKKISRPTSSQSSRPSSAHSSRPGSPGSQGVVSALGEAGVVKSRPKVNPFGDAKPREVILEEKGKDWRKIDMELHRRPLDRPESNIKLLKEEIDHLKKSLEEADVSTQISEEVTNQRQQLLEREKELKLLMSDLDDKIHLGEQTNARPGSGSGRNIRPSQSSLSEESRTTEFEKPQSYGVRGDAWGKPNEPKWGFQGVSDRGSFGNRNSERSGSRGGW